MSLSKGHLIEIDRLRRVAQMVADSESTVPSSPFQEGPSSSFEDVESLRKTLSSMRSSKSWRVTAPMRSIARFLRNPWIIFEDDFQINQTSNPHQLKREIASLQASTSWRITAPLRLLVRLIVRH